MTLPQLQQIVPDQEKWNWNTEYSATRQAPRSAPLSPFHPGSSGGGAPQPGGAAPGRMRHQSAGGLPAATIHYRPPVWGQSNGESNLQGDFVLNNEVREGGDGWKIAISGHQQN